ncbi:MAG: hypothetical protein AMXMBFR34_03150 [Myxococcaceae bacterium]
MHRLALLLTVTGSAAALACLWDSDTYAEEALARKDVAEVVKGRFGKHSKAFYEAKVAYTLPLVSADAGVAPPERYDDLAVAYDKLGQVDRSIALMFEKEQRHPGLYTTKANLGTFYAHSGDFVRAVELLEAAIAQKPDAHFGREKYQVQAIEYLQALGKDASLATRKDLLGVDLTEPERLMFGDRGKKKKPGEKTLLDKEGLGRDVFVALAGIIRFGSGEKSSHVWLSLGVALALDGDRHLALRAFWRADELGHPRAKKLAEAMAMTLRDFDGKYDVERLRAEAAKGEAEERAAQQKEEALLAAGKQRQVFGY